MNRIVIHTLLALGILCLGPSQRVFATAGFAEWEIEPPGGNAIAHLDPYIERFGTCLLIDQTKGNMRYGTEEEVNVAFQSTKEGNDK